ncbi:MAG TPA: glycosyltransferase [Gammaproteobacteria bacterium]|nr:glycosyltransferase [Gammaproteobacteria bacterium]
MPVSLSIIIPCLNEATHISATLAVLQALRGKGAEVILVDGGSADHTLQLAEGYVDTVNQSPPGRAVQMNAGAELARGHLYWFLHADTVPDADALVRIQDLASNSVSLWGRFRVRFDHPSLIFKCIAWMMNTRSCLTAMATGDQGIFVSRDLFTQVDGYEDIPLMEDIAISKALRKRQRPLCCRQTLSTSSRRWQQAGILRTIVLMWRLRAAYALGADPAQLAQRYRS